MLSFLQLVHDHKDEVLVLISLGAVCVSLLTALLAPMVQMRIARLIASTSTLVFLPGVSGLTEYHQASQCLTS
jgi:hypothetical protein